MRKIEKPGLYVIGSFNIPRDDIFAALPNYQCEDARKHPQFSVADLVKADMGAAEIHPFSLTYFPLRDRGTMSYAETASSVLSGNLNVTFDGDADNPDVLLQKITPNFFQKSEDAIDFLNSMPPPNKKLDLLQQKYPPSKWNENITCENVYVCGTIDDNILKMIQKVKERCDKHFTLRSDDIFSNFQEVGSYDMIVAHFPIGQEWHKHSVFMMGAAYALRIPIIIVDGHGGKYPPLQGLARRQFDFGEFLVDYLSTVKDQNISKEALDWYEMSKREEKRYLSEKN